MAETPAPQDWSRVVEASLFRDAFAAWRFDWLDVPRLIDGADRSTSTRWPTAIRSPPGATGA